MGEKFDRFKARHQGRLGSPPPPPDECKIGTVFDNMHYAIHSLIDASSDVMTADRWTKIIEHAELLHEQFPEEFELEDIGVCLFMVLEDLHDYLFEEKDDLNKEAKGMQDLGTNPHSPPMSTRS